MSSSDQKTQQILDGAVTVFSRYGLRKTTMLDIAQAANISRAALYLSFKNKEDVFRSLSALLHARALEAADAALASGDSVLEGLEKALAVFALDLMGPIDASPHGQELFDANTALAADISGEAKAGLLARIEQALIQADAKGEISLATAQASTTELAAMILAALDGFKHAETSCANVPARLALFMRLLRGALAPKP